MALKDIPAVRLPDWMLEKGFWKINSKFILIRDDNSNHYLWVGYNPNSGHEGAYQDFLEVNRIGENRSSFTPIGVAF